MSNNYYFIYSSDGTLLDIASRDDLETKQAAAAETTKE